ncbi:uncharacterized protein [Henckelia pumila]|uniref:uncharacterized protein n=1 Tax=Henckelia pumila TaxID=405737 RepID=UPI003C6E82C6
MENIRRRNYAISPDDKFSFPVMIPGQQNISDQFEFGCVTSPVSPNSPADHLFSNGRLLPHVFPIQTSANNHNIHGYSSYSRSTSRTSSTGSKDSLMSSRSNSTNSRSSNCSSARTSTSTDQYYYSNPELRKAAAKKEIRHHHVIRPPVLNAHECQLHGSSQKWQFIAAAPVLKHQGSRSRKADHVLEPKGSRKSKRIDEDHGAGVKPWFGKRVLKSFVSACKECHAIKTSTRIEDGLPRNLEV